MVLALILLNLAGGDCLEDLERLEADRGFAAILRDRADVLSAKRAAVAEVTVAALTRAHGAIPVSRIGMAGAVPRPCRTEGSGRQAVIPAVTEQLRGLWQVNQALLGCIQTHQPATAATLDTH
jgi:hypothetical protein